MGKERMTLPSKAKLRNLVQYRDMTDEEFEAALDIATDAYEVSPELLQEKLDEKLEELGKDYDLTDMKANDLSQLRSLLLSQLQLEELDLTAFALRKDADDPVIVQVLDKISGIQTRLVKNISDISGDLQLTRKIRKMSKEASVVNAIEDLREKARIFYKERMLYIFCPECKMLLSTVWLNYPDAHNILHCTCERCGEKFDVKLSTLYETDNKNLENVVVP